MAATNVPADNPILTGKSEARHRLCYDLGIMIDWKVGPYVSSITVA